jgi:hypothetical protein
MEAKNFPRIQKEPPIPVPVPYFRTNNLVATCELIHIFVYEEGDCKYYDDDNNRRQRMKFIIQVGQTSGIWVSLTQKAKH